MKQTKIKLNAIGKLHFAVLGLRISDVLASGKQIPARFLEA